MRFISPHCPGLFATGFVVFGLGTLASSFPVSAQDSVNIQFEPGASSTTINGTIIGKEYIDYVLGAQGGQAMVVSLAVTGTNGNGSAFFNILPAGQDYPALFNGSTEGQRAEVTLPSSGDWAIRVYLMGNDADTGKTVGFSLDTYIAPASGSQGSASSGSGAATGGQMAPDPSGPPFIETVDGSVSNAAVSACQEKLDAETDGAVSVVGSEFSQANTAIYMRVGANGAPWRCLVSSDGSNPSLMFMGSEGAL